MNKKTSAYLQAEVLRQCLSHTCLSVITTRQTVGFLRIRPAQCQPCHAGKIMDISERNVSTVLGESDSEISIIFFADRMQSPLIDYKMNSNEWKKKCQERK